MPGWIVPPPREPVKARAELQREREEKVHWLVRHGFLRSERIKAAMLPSPRVRFGGDMVKRDGGSGASADIMVIPVGTVENEVAAELAAALAGVFSCRVERGVRLTLPGHALNPARGQYLSSTILTVLQKTKPGNVSLVLGVTDCDLYLPPLNFVFGEADHKGGVAVISVTRLREEFYGHSVNDELFRRRMITEGVHELGHVFGLDHCPDPRCVMHFSNTLADTDRKGSDFCANCRKQLRLLASMRDRSH